MYQRPKTELRKAVPLVLLAAFFNTLMIVLVKGISHLFPIQVILFARYLITLLIILPFIYFNPAKERVFVYLKTHRLLLHLFRDILGLISVFCYFYAASSISLADATVLFNTAPLFIPIIAFFWGGLKIVHRLWWGMGVGFLGVILILQPGQELFNPATLIGLISGFCAAVVFVGSRYLAYSEPALRNMFYYFAVGTAVACVMLLTVSKNVWHVLDMNSILLLIGIGAFGYLYQLCFTHGARYAPVRLTSSFLYASVIFAMLFDGLIWHVVPRFLSLMGIL